jgi:multiple sugar transport system substrate-binding protein
MDTAKGEVTYCQGKDTAGNAHYMIDEFNKANPEIKAKLVEFPADAGEQRNQFIQRQQAKSGDCDVFSADVIWTAEFASQKWIYDMTPYMEEKKGEFIEAPLETVTFDGKIWGSPESSDAGLLYYRSDMVDEVPATWQEVYADAADKGGIVYQGAAYEGLTCDYLELFFAAGGEVLSEDGTKATIAEGDAGVKALQFMVDGIKNGAAPKAVTTYMEPESLTAFQTGKYAYMRNWPYAYALNQKANRVKGNFDVAPQPEFEGGQKAGILGGHNSVISVYSKNPGAALKLVDFIGSPEIQKAYAAQFSLSPVRAEVYDDPEVQKAIPFATDLRQAITQANARPVSPVYPQISQAIYKNANAALSGQTSVADAKAKTQSDIEKALQTF